MFSVAAGGRYVSTTKEIDAFANSAGVGDLVAKYEEEATGYGWVASLNIVPSDSFLFAIRYESAVELEWETEIDGATNALGNAILASLGKSNGGKFDRDLPALLGVGAAFKPSDKLTLELSYTLYFEEDADWDNAVSNVDNSWDLGISATYAFTDDFRMSVGYMRTDIGITPDDYSLTEKLSPVLSANSFSFGFGYDFNENFTIEFGAMANVYDSGPDATTTGNLEYNKYVRAVALGFLYRF